MEWLQLVVRWGSAVALPARSPHNIVEPKCCSMLLDSAHLSHNVRQHHGSIEAHVTVLLALVDVHAGVDMAKQSTVADSKTLARQVVLLLQAGARAS